MPDTQVDAEDVLKCFAEAIETLNDNAVADVSVLVHPKPVIKATLAHFITLSTEADLSAWLHAAFMTLARFQDLSDDERAAVAWKSRDQADAQGELSKTYLRLMARISEESGLLRMDLRALVSSSED